MMENSLLQYLDLYDANRQAIDDGCNAPLLNAMRPAARTALEGASLPKRGDEGYERTSVNDMFAPDYGLNISRLAMPVDVTASFRCDIPTMSTLMAFVVNDMFVPTRTLEGRLPKGVKFMSLARAARECPQLIAPYIDLGTNDCTAARLNTLLLQDGVLLHIERGVRLQKPLQLVNIFSSTIDLMAVRRLLIVAEEDSAAQLIVCDHTQDSQHRYLSLQMVQIHVADRANIELYDLEESTTLTSRLSMLYARQGADSSLTVNGSTLSGGMTRNDYHLDLNGTGSHTTLAGMAVARDSQLVDNSSVVIHHTSHCHSNQLFKYVLDDHSTGAFEGAIKVEEGAVLTEAYQSNRNLLASNDARMHTRPQLEIYCDDVKCSHGAATGQLDQQALFYMRARGIPEHEARVMLMQAFMDDVIATVHLEGLRERLRMLVERRFHGHTTATCADCGTSRCTGEAQS
jgi:Fe-S cluster assembly protein SufD